MKKAWFQVGAPEIYISERGWLLVVMFVWGLVTLRYTGSFAPLHMWAHILVGTWIFLFGLIFLAKSNITVPRDAQKASEKVASFGQHFRHTMLRERSAVSEEEASAHCKSDPVKPTERQACPFTRIGKGEAISDGDMWIGEVVQADGGKFVFTVCDWAKTPIARFSFASAQAANEAATGMIMLLTKAISIVATPKP